MSKSKIIGLDAFLSTTKKDLMDFWVKEQNNRLVSYAERKIRLIGDAIRLFESRNRMDRTGNLLDSLCWVVSYDGKLVASGYYREQPRATKDSYLHELYANKQSITEGRGITGDEIRGLYPVHGRALAEDFIKRWGSKSKTNEWMVAFAVLAPYWGYWESGHWNILTKKFEEFKVMTEFYDVVKNDLKPSKVKFYHSKPSNDIRKMKKRL